MISYFAMTCLLAVFIIIAFLIGCIFGAVIVFKNYTKLKTETDIEWIKTTKRLMKQEITSFRLNLANEIIKAQNKAIDIMQEDEGFADDVEDETKGKNKKDKKRIVH